MAKSNVLLTPFVFKKQSRIGISAHHCVSNEVRMICHESQSDLRLYFALAGLVEGKEKIQIAVAHWGKKVFRDSTDSAEGRDSAGIRAL